MPLTISLSTDGFALTDEAGHTIEIPRTLPGLEVIDRILRARQATSTPRIGTDSRPTQAMVKAFLSVHAVVKHPTGKTAAQIEDLAKRKSARHAGRLRRYADFEPLNLDLDL